jgi:hypothetical protein
MIACFFVVDMSRNISVVRIRTAAGSVVCGRPILLVDGQYAPGLSPDEQRRCQELGFDRFGTFIPVGVLLGFALLVYLFSIGYYQFGKSSDLL